MKVLSYCQEADKKFAEPKTGLVSVGLAGKASIPCSLLCQAVHREGRVNSHSWGCRSAYELSCLTVVSCANATLDV